MQSKRLLWIMLALVAGCSSGGTGASMQGAVTLNGQPIANGNISVLPAAGSGQPAGGEIKQGKYLVADVPLGKVVVTIQATQETGETYDDNGVQRKVVKSVVPSEFAAGVEKQINSGVNNIDFPMTAPTP